MGAMAFLYGEGAFLKTVGIATAAGFDCDNQAATLGGLLGVMHVSSALPRSPTHDVGSIHWTKPFNDMYKNITRNSLPEDNSIINGYRGQDYDDRARGNPPERWRRARL